MWLLIIRGAKKYIRMKLEVRGFRDKQDGRKFGIAVQQPAQIQVRRLTFDTWY